jgi:tellurite resistance protein TerB
LPTTQNEDAKRQIFCTNQEELDVGIFGKIFGKAEATVNRVAGRSDLLEAMCAGAALAAAADGNIDDKEILDAIQIVVNNETVGKAFPQPQIEQAMNKQIARANGGFSGKAALWKEIGDVARNPEDAEAVYLIVLDVVHSDGSVAAAEQAVLDKLAKTLGINPAQYAA